MSDQPGPWPIAFELGALAFVALPDRPLSAGEKRIVMVGLCAGCGVGIEANDSDIWCAECLSKWRAIGGYSEQVAK